jgi:4-hydroxybenzoyl-CoA thioesterase
MRTYESQVKIRFDDVDGAGIVYYPHYFHLCHSCFEDFFDDEGPISYPHLIRDRRQGFPTVAIESDFRAPLEYGDGAKVSLSVLRLGKSSAQFGYKISRTRDDALCFETKITTVFMNLDTKRAESLPEDIRNFLKGP